MKFSFMAKSVSLYSLIALIGALPTSADAWQYRRDRIGLRITGYGNGGLIEPDFGEPKWLGDWSIRGQLNYAPATGQTIGLVYSMDQIALDEKNYLHEAFALLESRELGRLELGITHSIARKLSVGLPDVGGLRVNEKPLFYKKISPRGAIISDTVVTSGHNALRANIVSTPTRPVQYGLSVAGVTDDYKYAVDAGMKIRRPSGKLKTAYSLSASFIDAPDNMETETFTPRVSADWRAQAGAGMNLQYNSWIWGVNGRVVYDRNPIGTVSDGVSVGTGISYDLLKYTLSLTYILSDTGVWQSDVKDYADHTVIGSLRYKYSENVDGWTSLGMTTETPFVAAGVRISF